MSVLLKDDSGGIIPNQFLNELTGEYEAVTSENGLPTSGLPPVGGATEAEQQTQTTLLTNIDNKTASLIDAKVPVLALDYGLAVSRGLIAGVTTKSVSGYNAATPTTLETISSVSSATYPFPTGAATVTVSSTSASDTNTAGVGVRTISVNYLRTDFSEVTVSVNLNGLIAVTVATDVFRINGVTATSFGSTGSAVGTISLVQGANVLARIEATESTSQQAVYTVPVNKVYEILSFRSTLSAPARFRFLYKLASGTGFITAFNIPLDSSQAFTSPFASVFPAGTDIVVQSQSLGGTIQTGMIMSGFLRSV